MSVLFCFTGLLPVYTHFAHSFRHLSIEMVWLFKTENAFSVSKVH